ncbi:putative Modin [Ophiocordyceps camponoti-floridani]|uniref:Putative Modin n=1 Tax=Ophiocordyceps camponoti-floridani TaxID=2030778 RepID=A0A8H4QDV1_9HYPO|nr:putative Modin [Ophiocordyceps camponoti-floridani]
MAGGEPELFVAIAALAVSIVALMATFMQVIQQYYASASGYSKCNEKVMGGWAKTKSRRFSWDELRYEVQFDAPVIFVSPPTNKRGPVPDAPIFVLDGTEQSKTATDTTSNLDESKEKTAKERIHTADNERASWLVLLNAVQEMEAKSAAWQKYQYDRLNSLGPPRVDRPELPSKPPTFADHHSFAVVVQRKRKTWDTMPSSVSRPYATTTICHLVEMMAALGVYWKEFDRNVDRYRAEGNGFMLMGERLSDLGLIFSFQVYGKYRFERSRVIPVDDVKELCFGFVPTVYREIVDHSRLGGPSDEPWDFAFLHGYLHMATRRDISETLIAIGCNKNTVRRFTHESGKTAHLFPLSFEILGMIARTFHIRNSCFTYLPNPTPDRWKEKSFSLRKMLGAFGSRIQNDISGSPRNAAVRSRIARHVKDILRYQGASQCLVRLQALHSALDDADEVLTARVSDGRRSIADEPQAGDAYAWDSGSERAQKLRRRMVLNVLRYHIQEVVRLLNKSLETQPLQVPEQSPTSPTSRRRASLDGDRGPFENINESSPDEVHIAFMDVYFGVIRGQVVNLARESVKRKLDRQQEAEPRHQASFGGRTRRNSGDTSSSLAVLDDAGPAVSGPDEPQDGDGLGSADGDQEGEMTSLANEPVGENFWAMKRSRSF